MTTDLSDGTGVSVWIDLDPEVGGGRRETRQVDNWDAPRRVDGRMVGRASFEIPGDLPLGWHTLRSRADDGEHVATLIVTPQRLRLPRALLLASRFFARSLMQHWA